ncbi:MAG: protein kinase [Candidatus Eisenbacteria bacterium]
MNFTTGARLGPYEIVAQLGAGGMGEVWLARDVRLEREVALKVLPRQIAVGAEALAQFRQEALALASLNHPNVAIIHGLEQSPDGVMVLVLERVEGESLAERIGRGPMTLEEALQICAQIAQALEVAHERGIVHRDLKPGNVMIGPRGLVKVLDFGLAQRTAAITHAPPRGNAPEFSSEDVDLGSATLDLSSGDSPGVSGTPGYMSPEQVRAEEQDGRTDIFAFGCVLYECLTGRRAFLAESPLATMTRTLTHAADLAALPARTPSQVRQLLEHCLEKDRATRLPQIHAARVALEEILGTRRAAALREGEGNATPHNLPASPTSFVGREATLAEVGRLLDETRLLTLAGLGGSGKTRLALRLAETNLERFPDGVWFVDVAPLLEPERLIESLAGVLGLRDVPGKSSIELVTEWLAPRRALVLIDNCETHPIACAELATELLRTCREVKLLVTAREPLAIEGESIYPVPTLTVPRADVRTAADAEASESVRLFCVRARRAAPGFELTNDNAATVADICRRLDGIPLALELAAARVRLLGVEQIRARLNDRFKLLTSAGSGTPSRQHTVRAVIQWTWDHLLEPEQDLVRRLAVFTGGWTLERATQVCTEGGDEFEVLDLLTRLLERSLVVVERDSAGTARYRFLESVWRFALEKLETHPEHADLRERHLAAYLSLAEEAATALIGADLPRMLETLKFEEENLLAALAHCATAVDGARRGARMAAAASRFWSTLGRYVQGCRVLSEALALDPSREPTAERSHALLRLGGFLVTMGDAERGRVALEEALAIDRHLGRSPAAALAGLGVLAMTQNRFEDAIAITEESLAIYEREGRVRGIAMSLHNLASLEFALRRGDLGRARFEAAIALLRKAEDSATQALCLAGLAMTLLRTGEQNAAARALEEALDLARQLGAPREGVYALEATAELLLNAGRAGDAALLLGFAQETRARLQMPHVAYDLAEAEQLESAIREALGAEEAERCFAVGRPMTLDATLAEASAWLRCL